MRSNESSYKAHVRKLRAKYRRNLRIAVAVSLLIGVGIGAIIGRVTAPKATRTSAPVVKVAPTPETVEAEVTPEATEEPELTLSLDVTPEATETPTEAPVVTPEPTEAPTPEPTATPEPEVVVVPFGTTQTLTAQINADGTARKTNDAQPFETLNFDLRITRHLTNDYYLDTYSTKYQMQGNEAGVEFEITLTDYTGTQTVMPQELFTVGLETKSGVAEQGFQLTDAEIEGKNKVALTADVPTLVYKRFAYSESVGDMAYLSVTGYVDGVATKYLFDLGEPLRPTPTPAPTPVVNYETLDIAARGDAVKNLQAKLIELGYLEGTADGRFGEMTQKAIKAAQEDFGMEKTGVATNEFQQKLYSVTAE